MGARVLREGALYLYLRLQEAMQNEKILRERYSISHVVETSAHLTFSQLQAGGTAIKPSVDMMLYMRQGGGGMAGGEVSLEWQAGEGDWPRCWLPPACWCRVG
jgi:hypothetical protein